MWGWGGGWMGGWVICMTKWPPDRGREILGRGEGRRGEERNSFLTLPPRSNCCLSLSRSLGRTSTLIFSCNLCVRATMSFFSGKNPSSCNVKSKKKKIDTGYFSIQSAHLRSVGALKKKCYKLANSHRLSIPTVHFDTT